MASQANQFATHPLHNTVREILKELGNLSSSENFQDIAESVSRLTAIYQRLQRVLDSVDPQLPAAVSLSGLQSSSEGVLTEIKAFVADHNVSHINDVAPLIADRIVIDMSGLPILLSEKEIESLSLGVSTLRRRIAETIDDLQKANKRLEGEYEALNKKVAETDVRINQQNQRTDTVIADFQQKFLDAENKRAEQFAQQNKANSDEYTELVKTLRETLTKQAAIASESATALLKDLENKRNEAAHLLQLIGELGLTGNYRRTAIEEGRSATRFRWIALILSMAMVGIVGIIAWTVKDLTWEIVVYRISAALLLLVPAAYAAVESANHRRMELANRRRELELAAIDPYLEKIPEAEKILIKKGLINHFFGSENASAEKQDSIPAGKVFELVQTAIQNLTKGK